MAKFFEATVDLVRHKTIAVQIAAESETEAIALAANAAAVKDALKLFCPVGGTMMCNVEITRFIRLQ